MSKIKEYARLAAVVVVIGLVITAAGYRFQARAAGAERDRAELAAEVARSELAGLKQELEANRAALARREEITAELASQAEALKNELENLYENSEPCALWADGLVPDDVLGRLRR